jgi:membrane protein
VVSAVEGARRGVVGRRRGRARVAADLVRSTLARAWNDRILGLAAEAGFWQLLSLPSLILGVLGTIGYFSGHLSHSDISDLENAIVRGLKHVIVPSAVESTVRPALHRILVNGRADVVSIGFVLSLWTGSSAMATYVNTITIAYGLRHHRGAVASRFLALRLYVGFVLASIVLLPVLVLGPSKLQHLFPARVRGTVHAVTVVAYWPAVVVLALALLATLYHRALPVKTPWRRALPGAVVAVLLWVVGSTLLRAWLVFAFRKTATYGPLSAPVAVLLFLYLTALAILFGAELNAEADRIWGGTEAEAARKQAPPEP